MMKVALKSFLAISAVSVAATMLVAPGSLSRAGLAGAQAAVGSGQVALDPAEFADYDNAANKQTTPQTQAPALEAFLAKYPKSAVKADVMQRLMIAYSSFDPAKAIVAADNVLASDPNNLQAYVIEVAFRSQTAQASTDASTKQSGLDSAADFAQRGLNATKPAAMSQADFDAQKAKFAPTFYSTIGNDDLGKKDNAGAIAAFKSELAATPVAATTQPGTALQDTYYLGTAYYGSTPPDYINCTFYTTRAASYAPDTFKAQMQPLATYCYKKYHGGTDGYDAVVTAAKSSVTPPSGFTIVAAPSDADIAAKTVADTPDLATLALSDKEFILQNGKPEDAEKVFTTIKGKTTEIPNAVVLKATADQLQVAISEDAQQSKTADFTYNMKAPLKKLPDVGAKVTLEGTYSSYTQKPVMIIMSDGELVLPKAPAKKTTTTRHK